LSKEKPENAVPENRKPAGCVFDDEVEEVIVVNSPRGEVKPFFR